ncbi:hypothetical protein [Pseudomonas amygdali]|uniref:hypothetical protein n=1 Tax=Pseudomonas amygdali TaxID=47877 RepID=UPI0013159443|nr:hypothetical protein [Pseudomonas amygdali]
MTAKAKKPARLKTRILKLRSDFASWLRFLLAILLKLRLSALKQACITQTAS